MITALISDFSRTILYSKDPAYEGGLNDLHKKLIQEQGAQYDIFAYFTLNQELLDFYRALKGKIALYLFTTDVIQNHPQIRPLLDEIFLEVFTAKDLGLLKKDSESYVAIANLIKKDVGDCLYIDDQLGNIQAAEHAGMIVIQFTDEKNTISKIKDLL